MWWPCLSGDVRGGSSARYVGGRLHRMASSSRSVAAAAISAVLGVHTNQTAGLSESRNIGTAGVPRHPSGLARGETAVARFRQNRRGASISNSHGGNDRIEKGAAGGDRETVVRISREAIRW